MPNELTDTDFRKQLEAIATEWEQAIIANDPEAIGRYMSRDWVIVSETGITRRDAFLEVIASGDLIHEAFRGEIISVRQYGDTAIVTSRVKNNGSYKGEPFTADEWTTDLFVKSAGQWRCVHSHITAVKGVAPPD